MDSMTNFNIDAYLTDHGWVSRATRLNEFGMDEAVFSADLGFENETEEAALRRGARWVLSREAESERSCTPELEYRRHPISCPSLAGGAAGSRFQVTASTALEKTKWTKWAFGQLCSSRCLKVRVR